MDSSRQRLLEARQLEKTLIRREVVSRLFENSRPSVRTAHGALCTVQLLRRNLAGVAPRQRGRPLNERRLFPRTAEDKAYHPSQCWSSNTGPESASATIQCSACQLIRA